MHRIYERHTEMAWQALSNFIHPLDCSSSYENGYVAMNDNKTLEAVYNQSRDKDGAYTKPYYFSKLRLECHLKEADTYCYRSRPFAPARIGYGGWDTAHQKFNFAQKMGLDCKSRKFSDVFVMLLGVDIDAKYGETDAMDVCRMLLERFPGSYHEPSTSGTGVHLYLKVYYPSNLCGSKSGTVERIQRTCTELGLVLERERLERGYQSVVDKVRGCPTLLGWEHQAGVRVRNRAICIKIPRFMNGEEDVLWFQGAPYVSFLALEKLIEDRKLLDLDEYLESDQRDPDGLVDAFERASEHPDESDPEGIERGGGVCSNSVCPATYHQTIESLMTEPDAHERCVQFSLAYARHLRRPPSLDELLKEYEAKQLNTGPDHDRNRQRRMKLMHAYIKRTFDIDKLGFSLSGFEEERDAWVGLIKERLTTDTDLSYKKGTHRPISVDEIAAIYFSMSRSQGKSDQTAFSIPQVQDAVLKVMDARCDRHKACRLTALLQELNLIGQVAGAVPGYRGKVWRVKIPSLNSTAAV